MSSVQQKTDVQLAAEAALEHHDLASSSSATQFHAPLDLEEGPLGNSEIEEVVRRERELAQAQRPPEARIDPKFSPEPNLLKGAAPEPTALVDHERERLLAQKFSALEREADKLRAAALSQQVEKVSGKKLNIASDQTIESEPIINRRRAQPAINIQVKTQPTAKAPTAGSDFTTAKPERQTTVGPSRTVIKPPISAQRTQEAPRPRQSSPSVETTNQKQSPTPEIVRHNRRPEPEPATAERQISPSKIPESQILEPKSSQTVQSESILDRVQEREVGTQMEQRLDQSLTLEQALKLDLSQAKIGTGATPKQLKFRGHSIGSGTPLDRLITAIADFIKRLEMRFFSFLDRKRLERKVVKVKLPAEEELENDSLHLQSFSSSLSRERKKRRRLFSRFRK